MDDKLLAALTTLAEKLSVTVMHLWGVLVRQAMIDAITNTIILLVLGIITVECFIIVRRNTTRPPGKDEHGYMHRASWGDVDNPLPTFAWFSVGLLAIALLVTFGNLFPDIISALFNPEYWALRHIRWPS